MGLIVQGRLEELRRYQNENTGEITYSARLSDWGEEHKIKVPASDLATSEPTPGKAYRVLVKGNLWSRDGRQGYSMESRGVWQEIPLNQLGAGGLQPAAAQRG